MYSSSSLSKCLVLVPVLAIQLLLIRTVLSLNMTNAYLNHRCLARQGKYKPGSEYEKNLRLITIAISSTSKNKGGFDMMGLDGVSATLQCRGDSYGTKCRNCFATALAGFRRRCPSYKAGIIWYDQCLLEISSFSTLGKLDYDNNICMSNTKKFMGGDKFKYELFWNSLIDNLTTIATNAQNNKDPAAELYAAGERRFGTKKMYAMVQCTKDISLENCTECVTFNLLHFQDCLRDKQGARVLGKSCNFRFEFYPFVTNSRPVANR